MTHDDAPAFAKELVLTAELFAVPLSESRIAAYFQALEDVKWTELQPAMVAARQCERWFPTPVVLRDLTEQPLEVRSAEAFARVWASASVRGRHPVGRLCESVVEAMGGWGTFIEAKVATGSMLSAQFRKLYVAYAKQERVEDAKARALEYPEPPMLDQGAAR